MKRRVWYWITDGLALLALLGGTIFVLLRWSYLPAQLPARFGADGSITAWGGSESLTLLLVLSWVMFAAMLVLSFFPQSWNIPRRTPRAYQAAGDAMAAIRLVIALFFVYMELCTALVRGIGVWVLPALLVLIAGNLAYLFVQSFRG